MIGPTFHLELLHGSRRSRQRLFRYAYAALLLVEFSVLYLMYLARARLPPFGTGQAADPTAARDLFERLITLFVVQQFALLLLIMPAFAAGSITDEKNGGTLQGLLITSLGARDIILGKYLAQVSRVVDLAMTGWPLLAFLCLFGVLEPGFLGALVLSPFAAAAGTGGSQHAGIRLVPHHQ